MRVLLAYFALNLAFLYFGTLAAITRSRVPLYAILLVLVLFSGLRYDAGNDFFSYFALATGEKVILGLEPVPAAIVELAKVSHPVVLFILSSAIYIISIFAGLKTFGHLNIITLSFLTFFILSYLTSFGYVRQYIAIGLSFFAVSLLWRGWTKRAILVIILSVLTHYSAAVVAALFLLMPFLNRPLKPIIVALLILGSWLGLYVLISLVLTSLGIYTKYFELEFTSNGGKIYFVLLCCYFYCYVWARCILRTDDGVLWLSLNAVLVGVCLYTALLPYGEYLVRVSYFFVPYLYVTFSRLMQLSQRKLLHATVVLLVLVGSYYSTLYFASINASKDFLTNIEFYPYEA